MRMEGCTPTERGGLKVLLDVAAHSHHGQGQVGARKALGTGNDVGDDVVVLESPHFAGPSKANHHLVADHEDAILVAQGPHALHVTLGGQVHPSRANDGLEHHSGNRGGPLAKDLLFQEAQRLGRPLLVRRSEREKVRVCRVHRLDKTAGSAAALDEAPAEVTGGHERVRRATMVRAVVVDHFGPAREAAGHSNRSLVGL
mmetsp:Transcript_33923/g.93850  ORF Transcript_33923/g.93850 Transcript_33923/m.93850 type:complete len:200 (-) Transcript_33923:694-1293(-)